MTQAPEHVGQKLLLEALQAASELRQVKASTGPRPSAEAANGARRHEA